MIYYIASYALFNGMVIAYLIIKKYETTGDEGKPKVELESNTTDTSA